jgi:hypothetical protein
MTGEPFAEGTHFHSMNGWVKGFPGNRAPCILVFLTI